MWEENEDLYKNIHDGSDPLWTPIAIVVVPATHTPDGSIRACGIRPIENQPIQNFYSNKGPILEYAVNQLISTDVENDKKHCYYLLDFNDSGTGASSTLFYSTRKVDGTNTYAIYTPSFGVNSTSNIPDFSGNPIPAYTSGDPFVEFYDSYIHSCRGNTSTLVSPYEGLDEHKSEAFYLNNRLFTTGSIDGPDGAMFTSLDLKMDGKSATKLMYDVFDEWNTTMNDSAIQKDYYLEYIPAIIRTLEHKTDGTKAGDWYIPSFGEIAFFVSRMKSIYKTESILNSAYRNYYKLGVGNTLLSGICNAYYTNTSYRFLMIHSGHTCAVVCGTSLYQIIPFISIQ